MTAIRATNKENTMSTDLRNSLDSQIPALRRTARWLTGDWNKAEDLLQDTMVLALRFSDNFAEGTNLQAWLTRVMRNRHISNLRRRSLEQQILEAEGGHALAAWSIGAMGRRTMHGDGDVSPDNGFCDTVVHAMDELRPEFREVVWLCDVEGMSYSDAASAISCPVGTIMSRLHRGRRALRRRLGSRRSVEAAA
ncbi:MAG: sigma-70 family RNA polymerase sigma factor [Proteobacteria bacterium]|jgi:RNA polymerase sigma-70 factor (ECF subfamily)|nr:sigma-70 family RNA polymerase sigma factor [Pseudomonadota bacterium]